MSNSLWPHSLYSSWSLQARILEWVAFPFSRRSSQPRDWTQVSHTVGGFFYQLSHKGSPRIREWTAYPFSRGSSWPRDWTQVSLIAGGFFTSWATREAQEYGSGQLIPSPGDLPDPEITRGLLHSLPSEPSGSPTWSRLSIKILNKNKLVTRRNVTPGCHSSLLLLFDTAPHSERRRMERMKCCAHLVQCSVVWTVPSLHPWRDQSHRSWCEGSCTSSEQHAI